MDDEEIQKEVESALAGDEPVRTGGGRPGAPAEESTGPV